MYHEEILEFEKEVYRASQQISKTSTIFLRDGKGMMKTYILNLKQFLKENKGTKLTQILKTVNTVFFNHFRINVIYIDACVIVNTGMT